MSDLLTTSADDPRYRPNDRLGTVTDRVERLERRVEQLSADLDRALQLLSQAGRGGGS